MEFWFVRVVPKYVNCFSVLRALATGSVSVQHRLDWQDAVVCTKWRRYAGVRQGDWSDVEVMSQDKFPVCDQKRIRQG